MIFILTSEYRIFVLYTRYFFHYVVVQKGFTSYRIQLKSHFYDFVRLQQKESVSRRCDLMQV